MTASERIKTMQIYRLVRLVQESMEQHQSDPCKSLWIKDDDALLSEANTQEQALYADATAIASRITECMHNTRCVTWLNGGSCETLRGTM